VEKGRRFYIKVRFGSMGKGITYLEKGRWLSNFRFRQGAIKSRKSDYGWTFRNVTGNRPFLKQLLEQDIIVEEAVDPLVIRGRILDLRLYVCFGKVLYIYPRSTAAGQVTTNISQGARGEPQRYLRSIPAAALQQAARQAVKAAKAMRLQFTGIDIMPEAGGKRVKVIEANTFPGFPKARSYNLSKRIIACLVKKNWK
jgi:glutathione synthase/RimK-type ligase-like ATP-grasp enzyme